MQRHDPAHNLKADTHMVGLEIAKRGLGWCVKNTSIILDRQTRARTCNDFDGGAIRGMFGGVFDKVAQRVGKQRRMAFD